MANALGKAYATPNTSLVRMVIKDVVDLVMAYFGLSLALYLTQNEISQHPLMHYLSWVGLAAVFELLFQLPRQHYRLIGRRDFFRIAATISSLIIADYLLLGALSADATHTRLGTTILAGLITGLLWLTFRLGFAEACETLRHIELEHTAHPTTQDRVLIVGAGHAGLLFMQEVSRHPELGQQVIGFVDDAPEKWSIKVHGKPVLGGSSELPSLVKAYDISLVILAIPSASGQTIRRFANLVNQTGVRVKTVPGLFNLLGPQSWAPQIKDVAIEDLLRRDPVHLDQSALEAAIEDSVVLITGGGGSIGSELARQVARFRPARIILLGRGENSLWEIERRLRAQFPNQPLTTELCDIRNTLGLRQAFERWKPKIVLHAAAHKHVPFLEAHPDEGVTNNVFGTRNVAREAQRIGTEIFVNISTDKAVNPTNVLGATKFLAECIVMDAAASSPDEQKFISVRFGNVLGSRGSVIPIFKDQIKKGGPLTVTHPDMTRYFMTIPEASQLVLQAGVLGSNGRLFVLDMGDPVKISDLATDMARLSGLTAGRDIEIVYTGIRPGEKLYEEIFLKSERHQCVVHSKIFEAKRSPMAHQTLQAGLEALSDALRLPEGERQKELLHIFKSLVPTYQPSPTGLGRFGESRPQKGRPNREPTLVEKPLSFAG